MCIVYEHIFPNGKKYVGITSQNPNKRWQNGRNYNHNQHLEGAIKKYGWDNIKHIIIGEYPIAEEAGEVEKRIIAEERLQDPKYGYNLSSGGEHGAHCEKTIQKMRESRKGEKNPMFGRKGERSPRYGCVSAMNGRKMPESAKHKISEANSGIKNGMYGKHLSPEAKERIRINNSGANNARSIKFLCVEQNVVYASSGEASRMSKCHQGHIVECCRGKLQTTGGYHWRYVDD